MSANASGNVRWLWVVALLIVVALVAFDLNQHGGPAMDAARVAVPTATETPSLASPTLSPEPSAGDAHQSPAPPRAQTIAASKNAAQAAASRAAEIASGSANGR